MSDFIAIIDKTFKILDFIHTNEKPIGISEISKNLNIPKTNTFRILKTLEHLSVIEEKNNGYILGKKMILYNKSSILQNDIIQIADTHMQNLCNLTNETINLGIFFENNILILHSIYGEKTNLVSKLPPVCPLNASSIGKIYLSHQDDSFISNFFNNTLEKRTIHTIITYKEFITQKDNILKNNLAYDSEEYEYGLTCISSGIFDKNNDILGGISISGPTTRLIFKNFKFLEKHILETAQNITKDIKTYL